MSQKIYLLDGKKYYEIRVFKRNPKGKRLRQMTKFDPHGKRISSQQVANRVEYSLRKKLEALVESNDIWTWQRWHNEALRRMRFTLKESTAIGYDGGLKKWLSEDWQQRNIAAITRNDVFQLIFETLSEATEHTKRAVLRKTKRIFQMALEEGIITRNPALGIQVKTPPPKKKVLNSSEANLLLRAAWDCQHRFYYHWAFALFTGMRSGEMYALCWTDIDLETGLISVTKQWTSKDGLHQTKTNRNRVVPISPDLRKILLELKQLGPFSETLRASANYQRNASGVPLEAQETKSNDLLLPRCPEWRYGEQALILKAFCQSLGIPLVKFHDLRATFITNMLAQGVPLVKVMAIVGHSEMSTTNEYLRLAGVDVKEGTTERLGYYLQNDQVGNIIQFPR